MLVTTQWPLKRAATSPHLSGFVFYGCLESLTELSALWRTKAALCFALELARNLLTSAARFSRQKTGELTVSLLRARSGQISSKLNLSKDIENGPRSEGRHWRLNIILHAKPWIPGGGNRYSCLIFISEDRLCANLRMQEQSTNMTSQCH